MKKYNIIAYRLNRNVRPSEVLAAIESLIKKHDLQYQNCLFAASVSIIEFEHQNKFHSNRNRNAILSILKKYPELEPFFKHIKIVNNDGDIHEHLLVSNFSDKDYELTGSLDPSVAIEITKKIPRPYSIGNLDLIFDGVSFFQEKAAIDPIHQTKGGWGSPVGNYIRYARVAYGSERHSYLYFSADELTQNNMRQFFLDLAEQIPGKYYGTDIKND